jgi:hypothetical protein
VHKSVASHARKVVGFEVLQCEQATTASADVPVRVIERRAQRFEMDLADALARKVAAVRARTIPGDTGCVNARSSSPIAQQAPAINERSRSYCSGVAMGCGTTRGRGFSSGAGGSSKLGSLVLGCVGSGVVRRGSSKGIGGKGVTGERLDENEFASDMPS